MTELLFTIAMISLFIAANAWQSPRNNRKESIRKKADASQHRP